MQEPRSGFVEVENARLHYVSLGDSAAPTIVLVHGMRDQARSWDQVAEALSPAFHIIALDLRGHGDSARAGPGGYTMANFVIDLADVVDGLLPGPFVLVGHSLGGAIVMRYAAAFPERVRALCVIEGVELPIVRDQQRAPRSYSQRLRDWTADERERRQRQSRRYATLADATARMAEAQPGIDAATIEHLAQHAVVAVADGGFTWKYDNAARFRAPEDADGRDLDAALAAIRCPTLLLYGADSWIPVPAEARLALLRDHRVVRFAGAGHWLHHQCRDAFVKSLRTFLDPVIESSDHA